MNGGPGDRCPAGPPVRARAAARRALQKLQPQGRGPSDEKRRKSWFRIDAIARAGNRSVHTFVRGGDPGYGETSKMIAEAALALGEEGPTCTGVVTPASAIGEALTRRLTAAGIEFGVEA